MTQSEPGHSNASQDRSPERSWVAILVFSVVAGGAVLLGIGGWPPGPFARVVFWMAVIAALLATGLVAATAAGITSHTNLRRYRGLGVLRAWFNVVADEARPVRRDVETEVYFLGQDSFTLLMRFLVLMTFSSLIAAGGILADSTAVVIGAMLIAPLITPIMGMALALAGGWPQRLRRATVNVAMGVGVAVGIGWFLPFVLDYPISVASNSQIVSRVSPNLLDLVIALAAGAAGAYALSRPDVSSSLPGVAIAIALVPPLSVVGVCLHQLAWQEALGAVLLFSTNVIAILIAGGVTFVLTGISPLRGIEERGHRVRTSLAALLFVAIAIVALLAANGASVARDASETSTVSGSVTRWLETHDEYTLSSVSVDQQLVTVVLIGPDEPPAAQELADEISRSLERSVDVELEWVPKHAVTLTGDPAKG